MTMSDTIYESPDGGRTIYSRKINDPPNKRVLIQGSEDFYDRWNKWHQILIEAEDNPPLKDAVEKAEVIYELTRNHDR